MTFTWWRVVWDFTSDDFYLMKGGLRLYIRCRLAWKWSYSARLPQFMHLTKSKTNHSRDRFGVRTPAGKSRPPRSCGGARAIIRRLHVCFFSSHTGAMQPWMHLKRCVQTPWTCARRLHGRTAGCEECRVCRCSSPNMKSPWGSPWMPSIQRRTCRCWATSSKNKGWV